MTIAVGAPAESFYLGVSTETKICVGCGEDKPAKEFRRRPDRPFGVQSRCQACTDAVPLPATVGPDEKQCSTCREVKSRADFSALARSADGLYPQCRSCKNTIQKTQAKARAEERAADGHQPLNEKACSVCGEVKPLGQFYKHAYSPTGRQGRCIECAKPAAAAVARANTDRYNAGECRIPDTKTCTGCRQEKPACDFTMRKASKDGLSFRCVECDRKVQSNQHVLRRYGISTAERDEMLAAQGGTCANCGGTAHRGNNWVIDHDHGCCPGDTTCGS